MPYSEKGESAAGVSRIAPESQAARRPVEIRVDENGHLVLPETIAGKLGLAPGASVHIVDGGGRFEILPNIHALARVYIEPTTRCNLACQTCIRNTWGEPLGCAQA
ncbi:MAG: AbrB/MazE/SpoVT family DNA-binding domain-containing protein [Acidobacteriota bacterium]